MQKVILDDKCRLPSGVPVKSVILLWTIKDPVVMPRKVYDPETGRRVTDSDPRTVRAYIGRNNHHIEIREDVKTGKWSGRVVTMFVAVQRVRRQKLDAVNRSDSAQHRFIMSLAEGETIHMRHPETGQPGYFVVFKLDRPQKIHFIEHWDARPSMATAEQSAREDISNGIPPSKLKAMGVEPGTPPCKVRVDPLGQVTLMHHD